MKVSDAGDRALVVLVPEPVSALVDQWRSLYDPSFAIVPPHVTVAYPPFVPQAEWPSVRPAIAEFLARISPFRVELTELGTFAGTPFYLWLKPEDNGSLARIHAVLAQRFPEYVPNGPFDYRSHVTVGVFESEQKLLDAQRRIQAGWQTCGFWVEELVYLSMDSSSRWSVCSRIPLGGASDVG
jgi:2'-5' RNA ligase